MIFSFIVQYVLFASAILFGVFFGSQFDGIFDEKTFSLFSSILLAFGVYLNFYDGGREARALFSTHIIRIAISVLAKFAICFGFIYWFAGDMRLGILAGLMSQIDPIYVSRSESMSTPNQSERDVFQILKLWSAVDAVVIITCVTIFVELYIPEYLIPHDFLFSNIAFIGIIVSIFCIGVLLLKDFDVAEIRARIVWRFLDAVGLVISVFANLVIPAALTGAFSKADYPKAWVRPIGFILFVASAVTVGYFASSYDVPDVRDLVLGLQIAIIVIIAQIAASFLFWRNLSRRAHIAMALSQQGGLTTITALMVMSGAFQGLIYAGIVALLVMNFLFLFSQIIQNLLFPQDAKVPEVENRAKYVTPAMKFILFMSGIWCFLQNSFSIDTILVGVLAATASFYIVRSQFPNDTSKSYFRHPFRLMYVAWIFVRELVLGSISIGKMLLQSRSKWAYEPGFIAVPLDTRDDVEITLFANMITMIPGTIAVDVSEDKSVMYLHILDASDPDDRTGQKDRAGKLITYVKSSFEKPIMWAMEQ